MTAVSIYIEGGKIYFKDGDVTTAVDLESLKLGENTTFAACGWTKDEDDMASDSNVHVPTQQSVKAYVDDNAGTTDGWFEAGETWTYASSDDPTYTLTISGDKTDKYSAGMRIKLTDSGTQYFIITKVAYSDPDTTLTLYGGTDYDLSGGAITNLYYSTQKAPYGFPLDPDKWTVEVTDSTLRTQTNPEDSTWYNLGSVSINIPIGVWDVSYLVIAKGYISTATAVGVKTTLSTANNNESNSHFTAQSLADSIKTFYTNNFRKDVLNLAAKSTYYLNTMSIAGSITNIENLNNSVPAIIRARCAYL